MTFWNHIYSIGIKAEDDAKLVRKKRLNNQVTLFTAIAAAFFMPYLYVVKNYYYIPFEILATLLIITAFAFNYFGWLKLSMFWRYSIVITDITFGSLEMPEAGFQFFLIPLALIPFILSDNTKIQVALFSMALICFVARQYLLIDYAPHSKLTSDQNQITFMIVMYMVFALCALFIMKFKIAGVRYEEVIKTQLVEIEEQKKDILDSITYAQRIQVALLPPKGEFERQLTDYFVMYKPKDIVSGDFYWVQEHGGKTFVAVADCTGHGVSGAMMSLLCITALTRTVREMGILQPSLILDKVAELIEEQLSKTNSEVMDGMDIGLCSLDFNKRVIEFAGAYNPLYIINNQILVELKGDKQPIGKMENRRLFTNHVITPKKGDCYYLLSDGFCDQFGGLNQKKYGTRQFKETLTANCNKTMAEQKSALDKCYETWKGKLVQVDDICVLGFRI